MHRFIVGFVAVALAAGVAGPLAAQDWYLGVEGGLNVSDISVEDDETELDSETGLRIGGVLRRDFGPSGLFGIQTGVAYSQKGASEEEGGVELAIELDYVEVPLLLTVNAAPGSAVRPRAYAGPQVAFEASCSLVGSDGATTVDVDCDSTEFEEIGFETKSTDFSLLFGGGLDVAAGPGVLTFDGRYDLGLSNINDSPGSDQLEAKNRNIQISAGYAVRLQ